MSNAAGLALLDAARDLIAGGRFSDAGALLRAELVKNPGVGEGFRVDLANLLALTAEWGLITMLLPAGTNALNETGWLNSLATGQSVDARGEPLPWLTYPAIAFLEQRVKRDWSVFEWGSGASTLWWGSRVARVHAAENDPRWHANISGRAPSNATIVLAETREDYVDAINRAPGGEFDVVVVDGAWRAECIAAVCRIKSAGVLVIDNSDVAELQAPLASLATAGWKRLDFFGLIPAYLYRGCTSLLFRDPAFLDVEQLPAALDSCLGPTVGQAQARSGK